MTDLPGVDFQLRRIALYTLPLLVLALVLRTILNMPVSRLYFSWAKACVSLIPLSERCSHLHRSHTFKNNYNVYS